LHGTPPTLQAVRLGPWKLHFNTKGSHCVNTFPDAQVAASTSITNPKSNLHPRPHRPHDGLGQCYAARMDRRASGGLLFNVERDMSEVRACILDVHP